MNTQHKSNIQKYLNTYAEPEAARVTSLVTHTYQHVLIIPAYNESHHFLECLPRLNNETYLVILVINQSDNNPESSQNTALLAYIQQHFTADAEQDNLLLFSNYQLNASYDLLVVDRYSHQQRIPHKQGVGLARKIAADIACQLIHQQHISSPWIHSSDADAYLPQDYFKASQSLATTHVAIHYPFTHINTDSQQASFNMRLYEAFMNYYAAGLKSANSPYAYPSLGSCIGVHYEAYASVRGFPKRSAGEDFYLLNKLRKIGDIALPATPIIQIEERRSNRVPFGTGPALTKIALLSNPLDDYLFYNPKIFDYLTVFLLCLKKITPAEVDHQTFIANAITHKNINSDILISALKDIQFFINLKNLIDHSAHEKQLQHQLFCWFDAFKTLKFIHSLEKNSSLTRLNLKQINTLFSQQPDHTLYHVFKPLLF